MMRIVAQASTDGPTTTPSEAEQLTAFLTARIAAPPEHPESLREAELLVFLQHRFAEPLGRYRSTAGWYRRAFMVLSVTGIAAGVLSSGLAAGWAKEDWARICILVLGLVTAASAAYIQIERPGQKAVARERAADALMTEGWAFLQRRGRYGSPEERDSLVGSFVDEVMRINTQVSDEDSTLHEPDPKLAVGPPHTTRRPKKPS